MNLRELFEMYVNPVQMLVLSNWESGISVSELARRSDCTFSHAYKIASDKKLFNMVKGGRGRGKGNELNPTVLGAVLISDAKRLKKDLTRYGIEEP